MNSASARIIIFQSGISLEDIPEYKESICGKSFSNLNEIRVNKVNGGYTILFTDEIFKDLDVSIFIDQVIQVFIDNIPNTIFRTELFYFILNMVSTECESNLIALHELFEELDHPSISYRTSSHIKSIMIDEEDDDDEEWDDEDYEDDSDDCIWGENHDITCDECNHCSDEDDDEEDDLFSEIKRSKLDKPHYGSSKLIRRSKSIKQIKRHGIIISSNKDIKKRDAKIIKAFLKDFIPGKSKWARMYREELLERWMSGYVISKKFARQLSRDFKKDRSNGSSLFSRDNAMSIAKNVLKAYDPFYDPNK